MSEFKKAAKQAPSEVETSFIKHRRGGTTVREFKDTAAVSSGGKTCDPARQVRGQGSVTDEENENNVDVLAGTDNISTTGCRCGCVLDQRAKVQFRLVHHSSNLCPFM